MEIDGGRRSSRVRRAPQRYEPEEVPVDDSDEESDEELVDAGSSEEESEASSDSTGSLADFVTSDDELEYMSEEDPDWEASTASDFTDLDESDLD